MKNFIKFFTSLLLMGIYNINAQQETIVSKHYFKNREEQIDFYERARKLYYNLKIEGTIVNEDGELLQDVKVISGKSKYSASDEDSVRDEFTIHDGKFSFTSEPFFSWGLTFEKKGYYSAQTGLNVAFFTRELNTGEITIEDKAIVKNTQVVLLSYGNFNETLRGSRPCTLKYSQNNAKSFISAIDFNQRKETAIYGWNAIKELDYSNEDMLPKSLIYSVPGKNEKGEYDGTVILKTNIPKSGFTTPLKYEGKHFFRKMREAPTEGYKPEIRIKPVGFRPNSPNSLTSYVVFYVKIQGRYGKAIIDPAMLKIGEGKVKLDLKFFLDTKPNNRNTNVWLSVPW